MSLQANAATTSSPIFLRYGFSSVVEFDEAPTQVVLGDSEAFQVEKLDRSLVVKPLINEATTNMFVYFKSASPKLLILSASDDFEPTHFKKFSAPFVAAKPKSAAVPRQPAISTTGANLKSKTFSKNKDYLILDLDISANGSARLTPDWNRAAIHYKGKVLVPSKLWSERKEIQKNARAHARFEFRKPDLPADLIGAILKIPLKSGQKTMSINLGVKR